MANIQQTTWDSVFVPRWAADFRSRDHLIPGGIKLAAAAFPYTDQVTATVSGAGAAINAETVPLATPLAGPIPMGEVLVFTGGEQVRLASNARKNDTTLNVYPLVDALEAADAALYAAGSVKKVQSGTAIGVTFAELASGAAWGPAADTDDYVRLLAFTVPDVTMENDGVMYRPGSVVKENLLPGFATLSAAVLGKIRAAYVCQRGVA